MDNKASLAAPSERVIILLMVLVQFINMVDYMMVMPLGPDFAKALSIPVDEAGFIGGVYTFAAACMALLLANRLDRVDRRLALLCCLAGLAISTFLATLATGFYSLIATRIAAGLFGGPAASLAMAIVIDHVPDERRGKAMALLMSAFPTAAVIGVPLGLELAHWFNWQAPFYLVSISTLFVMMLIFWVLPPQSAHLAAARKTPPFKMTTALTDPIMRQGLNITGTAICASFLFIPHLSPYIQFNLGYPREEIGTLYMIGGLATYIIMHVTGRLVDRLGPVSITWLAAAGSLTIIFTGFMPPAVWPVMVTFAGFMACNAMRNVAVQTTNSRIPAPQQRAGYMAAQSAVRHLVSGFAVAISTLILTTNETGALEHMTNVAWLSVILTIMLPWQVSRLHRSLTLRKQQQAEKRALAT
ncbi:MFS transporter [Zooshikella sp. RANM57]|uniref:MFS transporter n=1 Tax=Zooshikella sp. RANM57 TaxID=3425863 RepID=UPI003D6F4C52